MEVVEASWSLQWDRPGERLVLTIVGRHEVEPALDASKRFLELVREAPIELVVDLSEMTGYAREARQAWTGVLKDTRTSIRVVRFVGLSAVFRMAAATVCLAARIEASFHESRDDVVLRRA